MTIQEYFRILRRRGWIMVAAVVLAAMAAYGVSYLQKELYRATIYVSTVPARPDWGLGNTAKDLMRNFAANIQTPEVAQRVIDRAQLDMNPYDLLSNLQVEPDSSTFTIKIEGRRAHRLLCPTRQGRPHRGQDPQPRHKLRSDPAKTAL
jgi:uncharacterized protein involved in exopolysaccharide biosynthesis